MRDGSEHSYSKASNPLTKSNNNTDKPAHHSNGSGSRSVHSNSEEEEEEDDLGIGRPKKQLSSPN